MLLLMAQKHSVFSYNIICKASAKYQISIYLLAFYFKFMFCISPQIHKQWNQVNLIKKKGQKKDNLKSKIKLEPFHKAF